VKTASNKLFLIQKEKEKGEGVVKAKFNARAMFKKAKAKITSVRMLNALTGKQESVEVGGATPEELVQALSMSKTGATSSELITTTAGKVDLNKMTGDEKMRAHKLKKRAKVRDHSGSSRHRLRPQPSNFFFLR
jgi:hypothetical protein